jgi:hypothetical protein
MKEFKPAGIEDERIILEFEHFGNGSNCQTSSMVRLMHHLGHDISEPMLRSDCRKFPGILGKAARRLGGDFESILTKSVKKAHLFLKNTMKQNQPGLVCVDMAYLDYLLTGEEDHFGEHNILIYGMDEQENIAYISDRFHGTASMPLTQLQRARASEYPPFPAMNQMVRFSFPERLTPLEEIIPSAIRENADALLNPPIRNVGVKGMIKWSKELAKYPKLIPDPKNLAHALMMHYIYIETGGSGGAIFRQIYSDFLSEAGELLKNDRILKASSEYQEIVEVWREIANGLLPDGYPALQELREIQWTINHDLETKGLIAIEDARKRSERVPDLLNEAAKSEIPDFLEFVAPVQELLVKVSRMETIVLTELVKSISAPSSSS